MSVKTQSLAKKKKKLQQGSGPKAEELRTDRVFGDLLHGGDGLLHCLLQQGSHGGQLFLQLGHFIRCAQQLQQSQWWVNEVFTMTNTITGWTLHPLCSATATVTVKGE